MKLDNTGTFNDVLNSVWGINGEKVESELSTSDMMFAYMSRMTISAEVLATMFNKQRPNESDFKGKAAEYLEKWKDNVKTNALTCNVKNAQGFELCLWKYLRDMENAFYRDFDKIMVAFVPVSVAKKNTPEYAKCIMKYCGQRIKFVDDITNNPYMMWINLISIVTPEAFDAWLESQKEAVFHPCLRVSLQIGKYRLFTMPFSEKIVAFYDEVENPVLDALFKDRSMKEFWDVLECAYKQGKRDKWRV